MRTIHLESALKLAALALISTTPMTVFGESHGFSIPGVQEAAELPSGDWVSKSRWDGYNTPTHFSDNYRYRFQDLPLEGTASGHTPWSETYWPANRGGINARWNMPGTPGFRYHLNTESEVRQMSRSQLAQLSPSEKYDIFMGDFSYPTVRQVWGSTSPSMAYWAGICNGWSPAALHHPEPAPADVRGPSGITVPFGSSDVKGLLSHYYWAHNEASHFLGTKCKGYLFEPAGHCDDVNAGALHMVLANELGVAHKGFVADIDRKKEVWNQPVYGFRSQITGYRSPSSGSARGTTQEVLVHTEMYYADELKESSWQPVVGTANFRQGVQTYEYALELDGDGNILGGSWFTWARPDFLWMMDKIESFTDMPGLQQIYQPVSSSVVH